MQAIKDGFKKFYRGFKRFGKAVSKVINFVLLTVVYFIGVGFTSLLAKAFRKKFLLLEKPESDTYWIDNKITKKKLTDYYRSF